ncbi:MAG: enoyl-CoA hydratase [Thermoplasmatota archaeon]
MTSVVSEKKGPVGWLTLNRPRVRNALSLEMMEKMREHLDSLAEDPDVRVVVIRGNGPAFCAGHDMTELVGADRDIHHFRRVFSTCTELMQAIHCLPQPVIAQVHGVATAAGCQLAATCDLVIAESGARFATPGVKIGLFCSTPLVPLCRAIGRKRALDMLLTGRYVSAQEAEQWGLVNRVVEPDALVGETEKWARELAQSSRFTVALGKKFFYRQVDQAEEAAYAHALETMSLNCLAQDAQEGMRAAMEKRKPRWKDR